KVLAAQAPGAVVQQIQGRRVYVPQQPGRPALHFINERLFVLGSPETFEMFLAQSPRPAAKGPLTAALAVAAKKTHLVAGLNPPVQMVQALTQKGPKELQPFLPLLEAQGLTLTVNDGEPFALHLRLAYADDDKVRAAKGAAEAALKLAQEQL